MARTNEVTPLTIADIEFTVARQIEQCPKTMMLRELVMNAVEAAARAPAGNRRVEIKAKSINGLPDAAKKLTIWNTGPGMSSEVLDHICDLASSMKDMKLDGNFGMGAKVASLPSNSFGIRYRSCHDGIVSQVVLGKREGVYGKIRVQQDNLFVCIIDATEEVIGEGEYPLDQDWTEVVLYGNEIGQNTVFDPYNGDPKMDRQWIASSIYHRFFSLPEGVEIYLHPGVHTRDNQRRPLKVIADRLDVFGRVETVDAGGGIKIRYIHDPFRDGESRRVSYSGALCTTPTHAAVVYRGEMYSVCVGRDWANDSPTFGIPFGHKVLSVHVELPHDYPVRAEPYRRFLQFVTGDQREVRVEEFSELVVRNRPQWFIDMINSLSPQPAASTNELRKELQELLNNLRIKIPGPRIDPAGSETVDSGSGRGGILNPGTSARGGGGKPTNTTAADIAFGASGAKKANITKNLEQAPEIIPLRDVDDIADREMTGRAAKYYRESNQLFVNMRYSAVDEITTDILLRYATHEDQDLVRKLAVETGELLTMSRVGHAIVFGKAKLLSNDWDPDSVRKALEPESLSLAADGWRDVISVEYVKVSKRLGAQVAKAKALPTTKPEDLASFR